MWHMANFLVCSSDNPLAIRALENNYKDIVDHIEQQPDMLTIDWSAHAEEQALLAQTSVSIERDWVLIVDMLLRHLPQFLDAALQHRHMSFRHLRTVLRCTEHLGDDHPVWPHLDVELARHVQPTRENQVVPRPEGLRRWITNFLTSEEARQAAPKSMPLETSVKVRGTNTPGMSRVELILPAADAALFEQTLAKTASEVGSAVRALVNGTAKQVKLELYGVGAQPQEIKPEYIAGIGAVNDSDQLLRDANIEWKDVEKLAETCSDTYRPALDLQVAAELRDGTCRFPGCNHPAQTCDKDHVIDFRCGGWTSLGNLQCLCRHHHNMKTGGRATCVMDADGTCTWRVGKVTITTTPQGPLAGIVARQPAPRRPGVHDPDGAKADRFRQTFEQMKRQRLKLYPQAKV